MKQEDETLNIIKYLYAPLARVNSEIKMKNMIKQYSAKCSIFFSKFIMVDRNNDMDKDNVQERFEYNQEVRANM